MDDKTKRPTRTLGEEEPRPAPATPPVAAPGEPYKFKLSNKIKAHGEEIEELVFRDPTGKDIINYGSPIRLDLTVDEQAMRAHIVALANVPPSTVDQMTARDYQTLKFALAGRFFVPVLGGPTG